MAAAAEPICRRKSGNKIGLILLFLFFHKAACTLVANCSLSGCNHGGICIHPPDSTKFFCTCPSGWTGALCTEPQTSGLGSDPLTTPCSSAPCKNGGLCQDLIGTYVCICGVLWTGKNCEQTRGFVPSGVKCNTRFEFQCANGACINAHMRCDGGRDCYDGSDEKECSKNTGPGPSVFVRCTPWQFNCGDGANCIPEEKRCDGNKDCSNNADEYDCDGNGGALDIPDWNGGGYDENPLSNKCGRLEFLCDDGLCIVGLGRCDGHPDCRDHSDEKNCPSVKPNPPCSKWSFDCGDGLCIPSRGRCDRYQDCLNGADEANCDQDQQEPGTPLRPHDNSLNLVDILIVSCAMLMAFVAITIFVYLRRVRRMHQRYFAAVEPPTTGGTRHRHYRRQQGTPYRLSHHSTFCHHLPPHRCPASSNLYVSYNLHTGAEVVGRGATAAPDKDEPDYADEVPPAYSDVVGASSGTCTRDGTETPPPAYEDLPSAFLQL